MDEHHGRFCVTPEYPNGTYCYFTTVDAQGRPQYPYILGPTYYGVFIAENRRGRATIPGGVTTFHGGGATCFGTGCPQTPPLRLHFEGSWSTNSMLEVVVSGASTSTNGVVTFGASAGSPYPVDLGIIGMTGCTQWTSADLLLGLALGGGTGRLTVQMPTAGRFYAQGFALDSSANALGVSASNAGQIVIRD